MTAFSRVLERKPARIIELSPDMFADDWPEKPAEPVKAGLRLLSESDQESARAQAAQRAIEMHDDPDGRVASYNDALMSWAVASALCAAEDARISYLDSPFENVILAFTPEGIRRIWEELEITHLLRSPLREEIDLEGLEALRELLHPDRHSAITPRMRRLLTFVLEELS